MHTQPYHAVAGIPQSNMVYISVLGQLTQTITATNEEAQHSRQLLTPIIVDSPIIYRSGHVL